MESELNFRNDLLAISKRLEKLELNKGTSGNCSVRFRDNFLITPSGIEPINLQLKDLVLLNMTGDVLNDEFSIPSSEWQFHRDIYQYRPEINAIVHTHSAYAAAYSCHRLDLPAFHYMIAIAGGDSIKCAPYALFGTEELSNLVVEALTDRKACLLSNHGLVAIGHDLNDAFSIAVEVENLCQQFILAKQIGNPTLLSDYEMSAVLRRFESYGRRLNQNEENSI